jgi:hypothetical protein
MKQHATARRSWGRALGYLGPMIETYVEEHRLKQHATATRPCWGRASGYYQTDSGCYETERRPVGRPSGYSALMTLTASIETYAEEHRQAGSCSPYKLAFWDIYEVRHVIDDKRCRRDPVTKKLAPDFEKFRWNYNRKRQRGRKLWRDSLKVYPQLIKDLPPWLERLKP